MLPWYLVSLNGTEKGTDGTNHGTTGELTRCIKYTRSPNMYQVYMCTHLIDRSRSAVDPLEPIIRLPIRDVVQKPCHTDPTRQRAVSFRSSHPAKAVMQIPPGKELCHSDPTRQKTMSYIPPSKELCHRDTTWQRAVSYRSHPAKSCVIPIPPGTELCHTDTTRQT